AEGGNGREPCRDMEPERIEDHDAPKHEDRVHGPVLEEEIPFDPVDIAYGHLPDNNGTKAAPDDDEGHGECEGEGTENAIDREGGIDHLQVKDLAPVRHR